MKSRREAGEKQEAAGGQPPWINAHYVPSRAHDENAIIGLFLLQIGL